MRDTIRCFPGELGANFVYTSNHHLISKEILRDILKDEIKNGKPEYKILMNIQIIQSNFLASLSRSAIYEVIEITEELKFCSRCKFKNVRTKSAEVILRLFAILYFEYIVMPGRKEEEGKEYLDKFIKSFSKKDMLEVVSSYGPLYRMIFERHDIDLGFGEETPKRFGEVLERFYTKLESSNFA